MEHQSHHYWAPRTTQPPQLGDAFFLLAHDEYTGQPRMSDRVVGLGVTGALLAELILNKHIGVDGDTIVSVINPSPPQDVTQHQLLAKIASQRTRGELRGWLRALWPEATGMVVQRLTSAGVLRQTTQRKLLRTVTRWQAVEPTTAAGPWAGLRLKLRRREPMTASEAVCAALAFAIGLDHHVFQDLPGGREYVGQQYVVNDLQIGALVDAVRVAAASAAITGR